jgi:hypothetical protein
MIRVELNLQQVSPGRLYNIIDFPRQRLIDRLWLVRVEDFLHPVGSPFARPIWHHLRQFLLAKLRQPVCLECEQLIHGFLRSIDRVDQRMGQNSFQQVVPVTAQGCEGGAQESRTISSGSIKM